LRPDAGPPGGHVPNDCREPPAGRALRRHEQQHRAWRPGGMSRYGMKPTDRKPIEEGMAYRLTFLQGPDSFEIQNYFYSRASYEEILCQAGFASVQWHRPVVSPAGAQQYGQDYWKEFLELSPIIGIECRR